MHTSTTLVTNEDPVKIAEITRCSASGWTPGRPLSAAKTGAVYPVVRDGIIAKTAFQMAIDRNYALMQLGGLWPRGKGGLDRPGRFRYSLTGRSPQPPAPLEASRRAVARIDSRQKSPSRRILRRRLLATTSSGSQEHTQRMGPLVPARRLAQWHGRPRPGHVGMGGQSAMGANSHGRGCRVPERSDTSTTPRFVTGTCPSLESSPKAEAR